MKNNETFTITYYAQKYGKHITRRAKWTELCKYWTSKSGSALITCHEKWIESVLNQMKEIKLGLKGYRYLDEAIELCTELGLNVQDAEIIRTNSTGLVIYNPKNLAERVKSMKNKNVSRKDKILARVAYEKQQQNLN